MTRHGFGTAVAFLVAAVMIFWNLGGPSLMQPDEGRNAEVAREMAVSGHWLVPTLEGNPYLDKPAFFFATAALAIRAIGASETAVRLPSALSVAALLVLFYLFLRRRYDGSSAAIAVIALATSPMVFLHARIVIFDAMLTLFATAAILSSFAAEEREGRGRALLHLGAAAAAGLATLVKGPVGFLVPAVVVCAFLLADRRPAALRRVFAPANLALFLAVVLPWFVALVHAHPDFLRYGLLEESLHRFTQPAFNRGGPPWYYAPVLVGALLTWSVALPGSAVAAWRARGSWSRTDRLLVVWTIAVFVFFSLSRTKHVGYVLPGVVPLGALVGRVFALAARDGTGRAARVVRTACLPLALVALALGGLVAWELRGPGLLARLAEIEPRDTAWFGRMLPVLLGGLAATAVLAGYAFFRRAPLAAIAAFCVLPLVAVTAGYRGIDAYAARRSAKPLAESLAPLSPGSEIAFVGCYDPGLSFYLGRTATVMTDDGAPLRSNYIIDSLRRTGRFPPGIVPTAAREAWLASRPDGVVLLARPRSLAFLQEVSRTRGATPSEIVPGWWVVRLPGS